MIRAPRQREVAERQAVQVQLQQQVVDLCGAPGEQWQQIALESLIEPAHPRPAQVHGAAAHGQPARLAVAVAVAMVVAAPAVQAVPGTGEQGELVDIMDSARRSQMMARIRGRDTVPEMVVRRTAHRLGFRFRLYRKDLPGRPDLVFPRFRSVVFVHGCFWHRHEGCRYAYTPRSRVGFWIEKFRQNVARDRRTEGVLLSLGWRVLVIWECETRDDAVVAERLLHFLKGAERGRDEDSDDSRM